MLTAMVVTDRQDPLSVLVKRADSLTTIGGVITAVLSAATATLLGGIVFAIRLDKVNLPVEEGLRAIPRETLLLIGARELLLSTLVAIVLLLLARHTMSAVVVAVVMFVVVPFTVAGYAWPLAVLVAAFVIPRLPNAIVVAITTFVLACVITTVRFTDPPFAFSSGELVRTFEKSGVACDGLEKEKTRLCGDYLGKHDDGVYLGQSSNQRILFVPKEDFDAILLSPPSTISAPRTSLLGRLTDRVGNSFSLTPLDLWVGHSRKGGYLFR
jgi:hypothetical protein